MLCTGPAFRFRPWPATHRRAKRARRGAFRANGVGCEVGAQGWSPWFRCAGRRLPAANLAGALGLLSVCLLHTFSPPVSARHGRESRGHQTGSAVHPVRDPHPATSLCPVGSGGAVLVSGLLRDANSIGFMVHARVVHSLVAEHS